jgi:hypothetical protein
MKQEQPAKPRVASGWGATGGSAGSSRRVLTADQHQALRAQLADIDAKLAQLRQVERERR